MGSELICLVIILVAYLIIPEGFSLMATAADLQKLIDNMKRAGSIADRAASDAAKHAAIMDSFEQRLDLNHENMSKIEEYDKLMAAMDTSNGGPALEATFPSTAAIPAPIISSSTLGLGRRFDQ